MINHNANLNIRPISEAISVIDIHGEVTGFSEDRLNEAFIQVQMEPVRGVILNFEKMDYMNSRGIGLLISFLVRANAQGQKLAAVGLDSHFQRIFDLTHLKDAIPSYATEADAIQALSQESAEASH